MNKLILNCIILSTIFTVTSNAQTATINGYIKGIETDTIFIKRDITTSKTREPNDTLIAEDGRFKYTFACDEPVLFMLYPKKTLSPIAGTKLFFTPESKRIYLFVQPNDTIELNGILKKNYMDYMVEGSQISKEIMQFHKPNRDINIEVFKKSLIVSSYFAKKEHTKGMEFYNENESLKDIIRNKRRDFIINNPDKDLSAYLLISSGPDIIGDCLNIITPRVKNGMFKKYVSLISNKYKNYLIAQSSKNTIAGKFAPDFTLKNFQNENFTLSKLKGKYVVLDFWASWCAPCIKGIPSMKEYQKKYKSEVEFVSIACNDKKNKSQEIVEKYNLEWHQLMNNDQEVPNVSAIYSAESLPTKIIIDIDGKIVSIHKGESKDFYEKLDELIK
ncbi:TlpA disulfide reductase family protein [Flagellimonas onchidii]|uniref:TlpA disulfide reductase family protein n=1 Tax=Flagellimonas onchidii TaxID=2562684 RepID=UPI0010A6171C|nr:TlpA disulfide reductase family protein [Allomuricauda onchidii]